ncbi:PucR-like helix-turn-helix protein [Leucobacter komagatae]|uniref:PucR-like helix-turn-helix protein n=1 Tax=Leucobacter komagatae TaxID=55969 RepID=A0A542Y4D1_9MICO|nr:GAF domain-containing protein [Leucobacter komagatae]TQL42924.1 PucR-like helix-turn-helix protein [Leucobacter komagatae]
MKDPRTSQDDARARFSERRANVLSGLIRLFTLGKEPAELVEAAVNLVTEATGGMSVFVYFWNENSDQLVLSNMTDTDIAYSEKSVRMRLGEGLTGWSALHRKPLLLNHDFRQDPRFFDMGVDENEFRSALIAPIHDDEKLYGVFSLYSVEGDAFGDDELAIAEEVGLLLASALKRADTVHELELQSATARFLIDLPKTASASFPAAARECTRRILTLLDADVCIIDHVGWLSMATEPIAVAERLGDPQHPKVWLSHSKTQAHDLEARYEAEGYDQISATLGYGVSSGVLTCFRARRFTKEETRRLHMLATQVGVLIENIGMVPNRAAQIMALLASDREDHMLESLGHLGWKGNGFVPVLVQVKYIGANADTFGRVVQETVLAELGPETLLAHSGTLLVLLLHADQSTPEGSAQARVAAWLARLEDRIGLSADVGVGESTIRSNSIRQSLAQARVALAWSSFSATRKSSQQIEYSAVREVRSLPQLVCELAPRVKMYLARLAPLQHYDQRHGTQLLETVEALAHHGGSIVSASEFLFIHRNTLRQRLSRISALIGVDLHQDSRWPEILMAAQLLRQEMPKVAHASPSLVGAM